MDYSNHMPGFTKLFSGLVHSTVWREEMHVKVVWITMLALADRNGNVLASLPGLADASRVSLDQCQDALTKLSSPDIHSRTKLHEGRRIEEVDGGWRLLNYLKYRNMRDEENRRQQVREAVGRYRAKQSDVIDVIHGKPKQKQKQSAEEETNNNNESSSAVDETTRLYCMALDAVFHRRTTVRGDDITAKIKQRLKTCSREMIVSTPILVAAQKAWTLPTKPLPIHFLRDGEHPKVRDGQTYGAKNWIARSCESIDGTGLDSRLAEIARQAGVLEWLLERGAVLAEEAIA